MLPELGPHHREGVLHKPPPGFSPVDRPQIKTASFAIGEPTFEQSPFSEVRTSAQKAGLRYERAIREALTKCFGSSYRPAAWFNFTTTDGSRRKCQPDGLLRFHDHVVILEVKHIHTPDAWWQLRKLYQPVVLAALPDVDVRVCEICTTFDSQRSVPEPVVFLNSFDDLMQLHRRDAFYVLPWRP